MTVHLLPNAVVPDGPSEQIIECLKSLLARAELGEIIGLAYCTVAPDRTLATGWNGEHDTRDRVGMGVMLLHHRYAGAVMNDA